MNRLYIAFLFFIFISISHVSFAQKVVFKWDSPEANQNYKQCYQSFENLNLGESKTKKLTDCVMGRLKVKFPEGIDLTVSQFIEVNKELMKSCFIDQNVQKELPFFWNEEALKGYKSGMMKSMPSEFPDELKNKLVDCVLTKLKKKHPEDGFKLSEIKEEYEKIILDCQVETIK